MEEEDSFHAIVSCTKSRALRHEMRKHSTRAQFNLHGSRLVTKPADEFEPNTKKSDFDVVVEILASP
jgi:hypothetical protein